MDAALLSCCTARHRLVMPERVRELCSHPEQSSGANITTERCSTGLANGLRTRSTSGRSDRRHEVREIALPHLWPSSLAQRAGILESLHGPCPPRRSKTRGQRSRGALSPSPAHDPTDPRRRAGRPLGQSTRLNRATIFSPAFLTCAARRHPWPLSHAP